MTTKQLRRDLRANRQSLSAADRESKSLAITKKLTGLLQFQRASHIAFYLATPEEVDTSFALELSHNLGKHLYLPVINKSRWRKSPLLFEPYIPGETLLKSNRYGILEPAHRPGGGYPGKRLDLVFAPVVGFNATCDRIGMGAGFYDRTFAAKEFAWKNVYLVGLAFACQESKFDPNSHDIPMNAIVTESGTFKAK